MICNICGTQEATIHLTEIVNSQMMEIHLCEACAQEKGTDFKTHFNLADFLSGLSDTTKAAKNAPAAKKPSARCPECGMTYDEFAKSGRLGCAECYEAFSKLLIPLIKRIQRSLTHAGKRPTGEKPLQKGVAHDLKILHERLAKSIRQEEFEEAARIRDEIRQFEEKIKKKKDKDE